MAAIFTLCTGQRRESLVTMTDPENDMLTVTATGLPPGAWAMPDYLGGSFSNPTEDTAKIQRGQARLFVRRISSRGIASVKLRKENVPVPFD